MQDTQPVVIREEIILNKYEGDPLPENEFERMHIVDGRIVAIHKIENGEIVSSTNVKEVE